MSLLLLLRGALVEPAKIGGDDVPREEHWEVRKPSPIRDATLDTVIRQAYDKAMGRTVAVAAPADVPDIVAVAEVDYDEDDEDVLMLMMG